MSTARNGVWPPLRRANARTTAARSTARSTNIKWGSTRARATAYPLAPNFSNGVRLNGARSRPATHFRLTRWEARRRALHLRVIPGPPKVPSACVLLSTAWERDIPDRPAQTRKATRRRAMVRPRARPPPRRSNHLADLNQRRQSSQHGYPRRQRTPMRSPREPSRGQRSS